MDSPVYKQVKVLQEELNLSSASVIIQKALVLYKTDIVFAFSGAEDIVFIDLAVKELEKLGAVHRLRVLTLDTGRLHSETYQFFETVRNYYKEKIKLELCFPDAVQVENLETEKGFYSFYNDGHKECCNIRKTLPLKRKLKDVKAWVTGLRFDQDASRVRHSVVEVDEMLASTGHLFVKFNPLLNWTLESMWVYIQTHNLPYNKLHECGYRSIGCEPCTRATLPHENPRDGRWWYEGKTSNKECGIHIQSPSIDET